MSEVSYEDNQELYKKRRCKTDGFLCKIYLMIQKQHICIITENQTRSIIYLFCFKNNSKEKWTTLIRPSVVQK
jgi:hypothetical protein